MTKPALCITPPWSLPCRTTGASVFRLIESAKIGCTDGTGTNLKNKREAEDEIRAAFAEVEGHEEARSKFAKKVYQAHQAKYLSDGDISRVIGKKLSRTRIQQIRKKVEKESA